MARNLRDAAVKRFQITCERDPQIVAAFLGGSLAAGTADEVSDVDVYAVTRESDYAELFTRRELFMQSWGRPVFLADTLNFEGLGFDMVHFVLVDRQACFAESSALEVAIARSVAEPAILP